MQSLRRMFHMLKSQGDLVFNNKWDLHKKQEFSCNHLYVDAVQQLKVYYRTVFNSYSAGKPLGVAESKQMKNTP